MAYIVLDLEWNQAVTEKVRIVPTIPLYLEGEVIQVGAVRLNSAFGVDDTLKLNIRPQRYTQINPIVTKLTGITQEQMDAGIDFVQAMEALREWCGSKPVFITWGDDDIRILRQNLALHAMEGRWAGSWYNLQWIYSRQLGEGRPPQSLTKVAALLGLDCEAPAHDALNDARCTALICGKLDMASGLEEYQRARTAARGKNIRRAGGVRQLRSGYVDHLEAFADPEVEGFAYPRCGRLLPGTPWALLRKNTYISVRNCEEHGAFCVRLGFSRNGEGRWAVAKTWLPAGEDKVKTYQARLAAGENAAKKGRRRKKA